MLDTGKQKKLSGPMMQCVGEAVNFCFLKHSHMSSGVMRVIVLLCCLFVCLFVSQLDGQKQGRRPKLMQCLTMLATFFLMMEWGRIGAVQGGWFYRLLPLGGVLAGGPVVDVAGVPGPVRPEGEGPGRSRRRPGAAGLTLSQLPVSFLQRTVTPPQLLPSNQLPPRLLPLLLFWK